MRDLWRIITYTKELKKYYISVAIFSVLVAVTTQVLPLLTKTIIDEVAKLVADQPAQISVVVWAVLAKFWDDVLKNDYSEVGAYSGDQLQARLRKLLSVRYFQHMLTLPQQYFDTEQSGKILNRLNRSVDQIATFTQAFSNNFLQFIFTTILSLGIIFYYSWPVGIMLAALYPIFIWLTTRTSGKWREYQGVINEQLDVATGRFAEATSQSKVVKSFGRQADELSLFKRRYNRVIATTRPQSRLWHGQDAIRKLVLNLIFLAVYAFICIQASHGQYSLGTMVLLLQYAALIRMPIFSISFIVDQSQRAVANSRDYFAAMDIPSEEKPNTTSKVLSVKRGEIVFDGVEFGYTADQLILKGINFTLKPGTKTALVGESGEGKTTITNLLLGLYAADSGRISIDGQNIDNANYESLRSATAVVFQEPALFSGTIRENIAYGKEDATDKAIEAAARAANAHEFISTLPQGYDAEIGERGLKLSGGQKQRIAIARALLKDAPIVLLDEATSSLDSKSEHLVHDALDTLMQGRTTLIIAHRLSTIQSVDTIITLKNGRVDEIGSPDSLAASGGVYAQLLALQQQQSEASQKQLKTYDIQDA